MKRALIVGLCAVMLAACGGAPPAGDAASGRRIYVGDVEVRGSRGAIAACARCHPVNEGERPASPVGINLYGLADRAGNMVQGQTAEQYLRTAILDPDAFLAGNFQDGLMSREYPKALAPQQVEDLVAYMMTLKK